MREEGLWPLDRPEVFANGEEKEPAGVLAEVMIDDREGEEDNGDGVGGEEDNGDGGGGEEETKGGEGEGEDGERVAVVVVMTARG